MQFGARRFVSCHRRSPIWGSLLRYLLLSRLFGRSSLRGLLILPLKYSTNRRRLVWCLRSRTVLRRSRGCHFIKVLLGTLLFWGAERLWGLVPHGGSSLHRLFKHWGLVIVVRFLMIWILIGHFVRSFELWRVIYGNLSRGRNIHWCDRCGRRVILRSHLSLL